MAMEATGVTRRDRFSTCANLFLAIGGLIGALALAGCAAGVVGVPESAELVGEHPFPLRETTFGHQAHEVHGIDVAKFQASVAWPEVRASGIDFAFIKATEGGDRLDEMFADNWNAARDAGLPRGAYHFNYWCSPMAAQAEWFKRNVPIDPGALPPVLDLEWNFQSPTCPRKVARDHAIGEIRTFVEAIEKHYRKRPILYTDIVFHRDVLSDGAFSDYPLWVRAVKDLPQTKYPGRRWAFWQYTERGAVPGIRGAVDKNAFAGTRAQWRKLVETAFVAENQGRR